MPTLGLEPNTCSLHMYIYKHHTLQPELLLNASNVWKNRLHFLSALEHMGCGFGTVININ
jgi:hypothetical protein